MNYALVLNAFSPDAKKQAGRLSGFLEHNQLNTADGVCVVLYDREHTEPSALREISSCIPASRILCASFSEYLPENILPFLKSVLADAEYILFPGGYFGDELSVRLAARLKGSSLTGAQSLTFEGNTAIVRKKIYSGHVTGTFRLCQKPCVLSIDKNYAPGSGTWSPEEKEFLLQEPDTPYSDIYIEKTLPERESLLEDAACIAVAGRGLKNREHTLEAERLAALAGIPMTGSRPCVMNAWLPMSRLIGVSGTMIAPNLCILLGVSGAPALYSGIEKSRYIISVNNDPDAPVCKKADLSVCGDALEIFRAFINLQQEETHETKPDPAGAGKAPELSD